VDQRGKGTANFISEHKGVSRPCAERWGSERKDLLNDAVPTKESNTVMGGDPIISVQTKEETRIRKERKIVRKNSMNGVYTTSNLRNQGRGSTSALKNWGKSRSTELVNVEHALDLPAYTSYIAGVTPRGYEGREAKKLEAE